jgi:hypothetical protein
MSTKRARMSSTPPIDSHPNGGTPPDAPVHWDPPARTGDPQRRRLLRVGCLIGAAIVFGLPLVATLLLDMAMGGPTMESVAFGTGGSGCDLAETRSSFQKGAQIRSVVTFSPALEADATVTIKFERNGVEEPDLGQTFTIRGATNCIYGSFDAAEVGHYRVEYRVTPAAMPPASGEFDVTP